MQLVSAEDAVRAIPDRTNVIMPGGCSEPVTLFDAFANNIERYRDLTVYSGFSFGRYGYLKRGIGAHFRYKSWQASGTLRELFKENDHRKIGFIPIRLADLNRVVSREGPIKPQVVIVQTSVPQRDGSVSLGVSVGANPDFVANADLVIAEFNANMPVTAGDSRISLDRIHLATEAATPICTYATPPAKPRDEKIVEQVLNLIPDGAWVQLGIGAVPDRVLGRLADKKAINLLSGLLTGGLRDFLDRARHTPRITAGELAGDQTFYAFCHANPRIQMAPLRVTHNVAALAALPRFASVNSAIEVDLQGQSNGETLGTLQLSGVGGSMDYVEAAAQSAGGVSIIALPSTTEDGKHSKIVARLSTGAPVTTPRYAVDCIVTEYGVANLRGKDLWDRAEALIAIAHPDFRDALAATTLG
ncbi:MAG: acetyl-CoA hydrolase/transferase family protein [Gammaproteobacteria bacterium]